MTERRATYRSTDELTARVVVLEERLGRLAASLMFLLESIDEGSEKQAARVLIERLSQDFVPPDVRRGLDIRP
jgi:hypothetical protein